MIGMRYLPDVVTLEYFEDKCNGCQMCLYACPHSVFTIGNKRAKIVDRNACMECGACAKNCPEEALYVRAGVGCAAAIIIGAIRKTEPTCGCDDDPSCC